MGKIDWSIVQNFNPRTDAFSEDPDKHADPNLIYEIDNYRSMLGKPVYVSPVPGALARFEGSTQSQHYAVGRKSTAIDGIPTGDIKHAWLLAVSSGIFGGVGLYPHTRFKNKPWPMLHLDIRRSTTTTIWVREKDGGYTYPFSNSVSMVTFLEELSK